MIVAVQLDVEVEIDEHCQVVRSSLIPVRRHVGLCELKAPVEVMYPVAFLDFVGLELADFRGRDNSVVFN